MANETGFADWTRGVAYDFEPVDPSDHEFRYLAPDSQEGQTPPSQTLEEVPADTLGKLTVETDVTLSDTAN